MKKDYFGKTCESLKNKKLFLFDMDGTIYNENKLFEGTKYKPIDIHTPLWLWSRNGFKDLDESVLNGD